MGQRYSTINRNIMRKIQGIALAIKQSSSDTKINRGETTLAENMLKIHDVTAATQLKTLKKLKALALANTEESMQRALAEADLPSLFSFLKTPVLATGQSEEGDSLPNSALLILMIRKAAIAQYTLLQNESYQTGAMPAGLLRSITIQNIHDDIYWSPKMEARPTYSGERVFISDLHGNTKRFLIILQELQILKLTADTAIRLGQIYDNSALLTEEAQNEFRRLLAESEWDSNHPIQLLFAGDVFVERGHQDLLNLEIFILLSKKNIDFSVVASNHDSSLAKYIYAKDGLLAFLNPATAPRLTSRYPSLPNLITSLKQRNDPVFELQNTTRLFKKYFFNRMKLIDAHVSLDAIPVITIYTHAPACRRLLINTAEKLNIPFEDQTVEALLLTIDKINEGFYWLLTNNELFTPEYWPTNASAIIKDPAISIEDRRSYMESYPLVSLCWNIHFFNYQTTVHKGIYSLRFCFGHTTPPKNPAEIGYYGSDTALGKETGPSYQTGRIRLFSHPRSLSLESQLAGFTPQQINAMHERSAYPQQPIICPIPRRAGTFFSEANLDLAKFESYPTMTK